MMWNIHKNWNLFPMNALAVRKLQFVYVLRRRRWWGRRKRMKGIFYFGNNSSNIFQSQYVDRYKKYRPMVENASLN